MALVLRNTRELVSPENLKLKILLYGAPGTGKTTFIGNTPNIGIGASETGHGKGLLNVATKNLDFVEINSYEDFTGFCSLQVFKDKEVLGLDSLSDIAKTFVKAKALSFPRARGNTPKRESGVPELDDYGVMGELIRKNLRTLIDQPKHIIVSAGLRVDKPEEGTVGDTLIGPDLAGQMFLGSTAMFDIVLCTRTRSILKDPRDAKSRETEYFFISNNPGTGIIAKNRLGIDGGASFLPREIIFNPKTNEGTFTWILEKAKEAYSAALKKEK